MSDPVTGLISERFRLGVLLGTGGSASVFSAIDIRSGDAVALKVLHPELSHSPRLRQAFFQETRAAERVQHANIVAVLGVGVHDEEGEPLAWIALELAPGETLAEYVGHHGPLSVANALTLATAVLQGLAATHASGLIHRDVSPANIMIAVAADDVLHVTGVRLLDFGLADAAGRAATGSDVLRSEPAAPGEAASVLGSVNYMSPEQAAGIPVDERGDLYQLGGVLYFALTARAPFPRDSAGAVTRAHAITPPPVPSVIRRGIPKGVDRIVVRALLKNRGDRFASAAEMQDAILLLDATPEPWDTGALLGDDFTRRFDARTAPSGDGEADDRTTVLPAAARPSTMLPRIPRAQTVSTPSMPARSRARTGRADGWLALALVVGVVAAGWVAAAGASAGSSVAVSSTPSPAVSPVPTPNTKSPKPHPTPVAVVNTAVLVPELSMMSLGEARVALEKVGLRLGGLTTLESVRLGDTVLTLQPSPGSWLAPGDAVDLTVASGSNRVPATTGLTQAEGVAAVQNAGFVVVVDIRADAAAVPGTVLVSLPGEATVLRLGTTVSITVAGAVAAPPTSTPSAAPGPMNTPQAPSAPPTVP